MLQAMCLFVFKYYWNYFKLGVDSRIEYLWGESCHSCNSDWVNICTIFYIELLISELILTSRKCNLLGILGPLDGSGPQDMCPKCQVTKRGCNGQAITMMGVRTQVEKTFTSGHGGSSCEVKMDDVRCNKWQATIEVISCCVAEGMHEPGQPCLNNVCNTVLVYLVVGVQHMPLLCLSDNYNYSCSITSSYTY